MVLSNPAAPASPVSDGEASASTVTVHPPCLLLPKSVAGRYVRNLIDKGLAIRRLRIRYVEDLEDVRAKKAEWVSHYGAVLRQLFTNGTVADVTDINGRAVTLTYDNGQTKKISIPDNTPVVTFAAATPTDLKPGATVFVVAQRDGDGTLSAGRVVVGNNGVVPPM